MVKTHLSNLILTFKEKEDRKESDCFVTGEILKVYLAGNKRTRVRVIRWSFKRLRDGNTNQLVKNLLVGFLYSNRHDLPRKKRDELKDFVRASKKGKGHENSRGSERSR